MEVKKNSCYLFTEGKQVIWSPLFAGLCPECIMCVLDVFDETVHEDRRYAVEEYTTLSYIN